MSSMKCTLLALVLLGIAGCSKTSQEIAEQQKPAAEQEPAPQAALPQVYQEEAPQAAAPAPSRQEPPLKEASKTPQVPVEVAKAVEPELPPVAAEPAPPVIEEPAVPQVQEPRFVTIPNGETIQVRLQDPLDSTVNQSGDMFRALLDQDIKVDGNLIASRGSLIEGKLLNVTQSGRVEGRATMALQLVNLQVGDQSYSLQTEILTFEAESTKKKDVAKVGIGAGIGAAIGAIAGGGKGAAIGAAIGGGAGGATVLATRGEEIQFEVEYVFAFALSGDVMVRLE